MISNRKTTQQKLYLNTMTSLLFEVCTIVCGLILPRLIISAYGSKINGLVNSIAQFLQIISFLDMGVGAVVQSALYKPLAQHNMNEVSRIISSAQKFFSRIALVLTAYVILMMGIYPFIVRRDFGVAYSMLLVAAMSISYFAQYYFGVVDRLLLLANQEGYVQYLAQIITLVLNTIACVIIIQLGLPIHIVKLATSLIFLIRPFALRAYVNSHYRIKRKMKYTGEPIRQKWNGVTQHISYVVLTSTDNIVLTLFSTLSNVSIYSVYHLVIYGIKQLFLSMTNGIKAIIGNLWARNDVERLEEVFGITEWLMHTATVFVFCCTWRLILPFVSLFTKNVTDAQYIQPAFATVLILAHAIHCLRIPYNMLILASGAYKEAQNMHILTAVINLVVSIATVHYAGLIGVAIGTLVAMIYQTIWMIVFDSRNNIRWPIRRVIKQVIVDIINVLLIVIATSFVSSEAANYIDWIILAVKMGIICFIIVFISSMVFYRKQVLRALKRIRK